MKWGATEVSGHSIEQFQQWSLDRRLIDAYAVTAGSTDHIRIRPSLHVINRLAARRLLVNQMRKTDAGDVDSFSRPPHFRVTAHLGRGARPRIIHYAPFAVHYIDDMR